MFMWNKINAVICVCVLILCNLVLICSCGKIPSEIKTCKRGDPELHQCMLKESRRYLKSFCRGIPDLKIPSIDPLKLGKADIISESSMLQVKQKSGLLHNLCDADIKQFVVDPITKVGSIQLKASAKFDLDVQFMGRILLIALDGKGSISSKLDDFNLQLDYKWDLNRGSDDMEYVKIHNFSYSYTYAKAKFEIHNLFGENKLLESVAKNIADSNPDLLIVELGRPTLDVIIKKIFQILNKSFSAVPFDEILPL